ncbi:MAG: PrsW family intramembrane metalloprotease [Chloroflexi bacterium]|nr:PrsW family intramembrane metalloprotease [Chloroflexota bacterium]
MPEDRKKLPGVLLLMLSALGFFFGLAGALLTLVGLSFTGDGIGFAESLSVVSSGLLSFMIALLNLPAIVVSIRYLRGKPIDVAARSLFKQASLSLILWGGTLAAGTFAIENANAPLLVAVLTVAAVILPIWWLVEFSRRRLPRSNAAREWGTLAVGLTVSPLIIIVIEILLMVVVGVGIFFALSTQPEAIRQIREILRNIDEYRGSLEQLELLIYDLAQNPLVAGGLFLVIGILAPFVEEFFKPMAIWFLLKRPLKDHEGFSLGLISGGAFALLESTGLVGQIAPDTWLTAVILRAATGMLHIGLSGLVGYGLVRTWNQGSFARSLLYLLAAGALHGAWNSLALLSGFATSPMQSASAGFEPTIQSILPIIGMGAVFIAVLIIVLRIHRNLRSQLLELQSEQVSQPQE